MKVGVGKANYLLRLVLFGNVRFDWPNIDCFNVSTLADLHCSIYMDCGDYEWSSCGCIYFGPAYAFVCIDDYQYFVTNCILLWKAGLVLIIVGGYT